MKVAKTIEFDAGHRVPGHQGQCRSPHGHRFKLQVTVEGEVADTGMILDFADIKNALIANVHDPWDHAFLVWQDDHIMLAALSVDPTWKSETLAYPPTAENLARIAAGRLARALDGPTSKVIRVDVWETPTSVATWEADHG